MRGVAVRPPASDRASPEDSPGLPGPETRGAPACGARGQARPEADTRPAGGAPRSVGPPLRPSRQRQTRGLARPLAPHLEDDHGLALVWHASPRLRLGTAAYMPAFGSAAPTPNMAGRGWRTGAPVPRRTPGVAQELLRASGYPMCKRRARPLSVLVDAHLTGEVLEQRSLGIGRQRDVRHLDLVVDGLDDPIDKSRLTISVPTRRRWRVLPVVYSIQASVIGTIGRRRRKPVIGSAPGSAWR